MVKSVLFYSVLRPPCCVELRKYPNMQILSRHPIKNNIFLNREKYFKIVFEMSV